jgi:hypothetical protein
LTKLEARNKEKMIQKKKKKVGEVVRERVEDFRVLFSVVSGMGLNEKVIKKKKRKEVYIIFCI